VLSWIRHEVEYACSKDLCDPVYRTDALFTMEKRKGNCVSYAQIAIGENDTSRTVDVLVTAIPPSRAAPTGRFAVVCMHKGVETGRMAFDVTVDG